MKMKTTPVLTKGSKLLLLTGILLLSALFSNAQGISLKAKILDKNQNPVNGEAHLLNPADSALVKGAPVVNGVLQIDEVPVATAYLLKINADGYSDHYFAISPKGETFDAGTLTLTNKLVVGDQANVVAKARLFRHTAEGNTKISVENTMLGNSISAREILAKSPGVSIIGNRIFYFGKGEAVLYLNGKQTTMERIMSLPVSSIKDVEIIPNPSSKYDARGRAVINIIAKKNDMEGWQVTTTHHSTFAKYYMHSYQSDLYYRKNKTNLFFNYMNSDLGYDWNRTQGKYRFTNPLGVTTASFTNYEAKIKVPGAHNYRAGFTYDFDDKTDLSIQYDGLYSLNLLDIHINNNYWDQFGKGTYIYNKNDATTRQKNSSLNINMNRRLDTLGSSLFLGLQKNWFVNNLDDNMRQETTSFGYNGSSPYWYANYIHNENRNRINLAIAQLDWTKVRSTDGGIFETFESGLKYSQVHTKSRANVFFRPITEPTWQDILYLKNDFQYEEKISAFYAQMKGKLSSKWSYTAGFRGEMTDVLTTRYDFIDNKVKYPTDSTYTNLFPSIKLDQKINDKWSISYNLNRKITRPFYQDLDPFVWIQDSLTTVVGNPFLTPELANNAEVAVTYKSFTFTASYSRQKNTSRVYPSKGQNGDNHIYIIRENMKLLHFFFASLESSVSKGNFFNYSKVQLNYGKFVDGKTPDRARFANTVKPLPQAFFWTYLQYNIPNWFSVDIDARLLTKGSSGITVIYPFGWVTAGISRNFFKDKLSARFMFSDIWRTNYSRNERTMGGIYAYLDQVGNWHNGRLTLVYKFGQLKAANYRNKSVLTEAEQKRIIR